MADNTLETLYAQMFAGIAELINGEGGGGRLQGLTLNEECTAVIAELRAETPAFLTSLLEEIKDEVRQWRVNPFNGIALTDNRHLEFTLKPDNEIERLYREAGL